MGPVYLTPLSQASPASELNASLKAIYALLGAGPEDRFAFTSSVADSTNKILLSHYLESVHETGRNHLLTLPGLENSTQSVLKKLQLLGCAVKPLPLNAQGQLTRDALVQSIGPRSSLLTLSWAHGLTGVIQPIDEIAAVCKEHGISLHVDATFVLGKLFFRFQDLDVDYLSFDGVLLGAPPGTGGLLVRGAVPFESGQTPPLHGLKALVHTLDEWMHHFDHLSTETARLRSRLENGIASALPEAKVLLENVERLPNTAVIAFPGIASEALVYLLQRKGIYASCGGGDFPSLSSLLIS